jgi:hypothetical protein
LSSVPAHRNEVLTLDITDSDPPSTINVRVTDSVPVLFEGVVRHRLRLAVIAEAEGVVSENDRAVESTG